MKQKDIEGLISRWQGNGVVTPEQANYMLQDLKTSTSEQSGKKLITIVSLVGAAVLTAGVLLIIASNWTYLGKTVQLLLALLLPVIPLSVAYYMVEVRQSESVLSRVANVFGVGLIGGALSLIGQIYHLESGYTTLMFFWLLLSMPFIFVFRRPENVGISSVLGGLAIFTCIIEWFDDWWLDEQSFTITITVVFAAYCLLLYLVGKSLRNSVVWGSGAGVLRLLSASVATVTLFVTTFEFYARLVTDSGYRESGWIPLSIVFNLFFIGFLVFVLVQAIKYQEERLVYGAVRMMFIYVIVKYFTLFSGILDTGLLFVVGGIMFIAGAWYLEKNKQKLMVLMQNTEPPTSNIDSGFSPQNVNRQDYE
ncbi:DUF2157 domain-containing protein [Candidatus Nomurabacteria bacterium]|nr:DUF2157 domain-containing protein [Candidatus Nomurabacteria bacterium]